MRSDAPPPIRKSVEVNTTAEHAFRVFTGDMHRWWPASCDPSEGRNAVILEPGVGGRWFERSTKGTERQMGRVLIWEPPHRVVLAYQVRLDRTFDPNLETEVEITFTPTASGKILVQVEHRKLENFGLQAVQAFDALNGPKAWVGILTAFQQSF